MSSSHVNSSPLSRSRAPCSPLNISGRGREGGEGEREGGRERGREVGR